MTVKALAFFAYILFAAYILYGEIGLNRYGTKQGALNKIDAAEKKEIDALMESDVVKANLKIYEVRAGRITENSESLNAKNTAAISERGTSVNPYNGMVMGNDNRAGSIQSEYQKYVDEIKAPIIKKYKEQREDASNESNIISLGVAMPCAALFLCLFSAWVYPPGTPHSKNRGLQSSYVAQFMSCVITYDAVLIQQGVWIKALALSAGAFIAIPTGHYFAGLLWLQIQSEYVSRKARKVQERIDAQNRELEFAQKKIELTAQIEEQRKIEAANEKARQTAAKHEHEITIEMLPDEFDDAIALIKKERDIGNGDGLAAMVARKFGKSEAWVSKSVKRLNSGETH